MLKKKKSKEFYTGQGDPFLDFQGEGKNFATIGMNDMQFIVSIRNTHPTESRRILLIPGWHFMPMDARIVSTDPNAVFAPRLGVLSEITQSSHLLDIDGKGDLKATGAPFRLDDMYHWISEYPTTLAAIRVSSTDPNQVLQILTLRQKSPFKELETRKIFLGQNQSEDTFRDKLVTVMTPGLVLSKQTQLEMTITPNSTCCITFFFGGSLSIHTLMQHKVDKAIRCVSSFEYKDTMYRKSFFSNLSEFIKNRIGKDSKKIKELESQIRKLRSEIESLNKTILEFKSEAKSK